MQLPSSDSPPVEWTCVSVDGRSTSIGLRGPTPFTVRGDGLYSYYEWRPERSCEWRPASPVQHAYALEGARPPLPLIVGAKPAVTLSVHLADRIERLTDGNLADLCHYPTDAKGQQPESPSPQEKWQGPGAFLGGVRSTCGTIASPARFRSASIVLSPLWAYAAFGRPMYELTDAVVALDDLEPGMGVELVERCSTASSPQALVRTVLRWVAERAVGSRVATTSVGACELIAGCHGRVTVTELARLTGWSPGRLLKVFRDEVGVSPKQFARLVRFEHARALVTEGTASLSEIAGLAGYYDQPHMNAEFRDLGGCTPGDLRRVENSDENLVLTRLAYVNLEQCRAEGVRFFQDGAP